jgi:hypothetical protein
MIKKSALVRKLNDAILFQPTAIDGASSGESDFDESEFLVKNHNNETMLPSKEVKLKNIDRFLVYTMNHSIFKNSNKYFKHSIDDVDDADQPTFPCIRENRICDETTFLISML